MRILMQMNNVYLQKRKIKFRYLEFASEIDEISETMIAFWETLTTKHNMNIDNVSM